jgi:hypothetical protein
MEYAKPELVVVGSAAAVVLGSELGGNDDGTGFENQQPMVFTEAGLDD